MSREGSLWMGGLEPYMDDSFVNEAYVQMGEPPLNVKVMKNKFTGQPLGYCFVQFKDDQEALLIMHRLNGKIIPKSQPPSRFKLNHASINNRSPFDREFSLWIGDLSTEVDDYALFKCFATRYPSIRTAKVIMDQAGFSRGYGFIRFAMEEEQKDALLNMNGFRGLGTRSLKVSLAFQKGMRQSKEELLGLSSTTTDTDAAQLDASAEIVAAAWANQQSSTTEDYSQYYEQYWQNYAAWQNYGNYYGTTPANTGYAAAPGYTATEGYSAAPPSTEEDDLELVEHSIPVDVNAMNVQVIARSHDFWDALDKSRWFSPEALEG